MKKAMISTVGALVLLVGASGCYTMHHQVGTGGTGGTTAEERQWFILWGLIPLGEADSKALAGDAANYTVTTEQSIIDVLLNLVTGIVTIHSRTVTVEK